MQSPIIAICFSDIHLSLKPPTWRSNEEDWFDCMRKTFNEIENIRQKHNCICICAGDIFDKWNSPPELINFAAEHLPKKIYAIPGQHDLPYHNEGDIKKSGYYSLMKMGVVQNVINTISLKYCNLTGVLYGKKIKPPLTNTINTLNILLCHRYIWRKGCSFPGAPLADNVIDTIKGLIGYDIAVFGDNHKGFIYKSDNRAVINCGGLFRRKSDEVEYKPSVWLIKENRQIIQHFLNTKNDKHIEQKNTGSGDINIEGLYKELSAGVKTSLDFREAVKTYCQKHKVKKSIQLILNEAMK